MSARWTTAVALFGAKEGPLKGLLRAVQGIVSGELGEKFHPYALEQIHGTLIGLDFVIDQESGLPFQEHYSEVTGSAAPIVPEEALAILRSGLEPSFRVRIGGYDRGSDTTFESRGLHPYHRMFSVQGDAFVLVGWPLVTIEHGPSQMPLNDLRRSMNKAGIMHRYHQSMTDNDNDLYLVIGHHEAPPGNETAAAVSKGCSYLAEHPIEIDLGIKQVAVVVSESRTLVPTLFTGRIPADEAAILKLFT
jgi:hypothetical protein